MQVRMQLSVQQKIKAAALGGPIEIGEALGMCQVGPMGGMA
jgi:hypothetical protein